MKVSSELVNYCANKRLQTLKILNYTFLAAMKNLTQYRELLKFPTDEDLTGAATALIRLQDTYKLDTASVARGELNGIQYSTQLSGK